MRYFSQQDKEKIIDLYQSGYSIQQIAKNVFHCRTTFISEILQKNNISKRKNTGSRILSPEEGREICKLYKTGKYTQKLLAEKYHCSTFVIHNVLTANNIEIKQHFNLKNLDLKEDFFETIDSEEKAYFLGFLFADGYVEKNEICCEINIKDIDLLLTFKQLINSQRKISYRKRTNTEMVSIKINSFKMVQDLSKYGIIPNKTKNTKHLPQIPEPFQKDFLRGLIDGDGWITKDKLGYYHLGFVSFYKTICEDFQKMCQKVANITNTAKITVKNNNFVSQFQSQKLVKQLVTALYKDSNYYLTRKYIIAEDIFRVKNDEDIV